MTGSLVFGLLLFLLIHALPSPRWEFSASFSVLLKAAGKKDNTVNPKVTFLDLFNPY